MNKEPDHLDVLQNIESAVVASWRQHRDMTDHVAARAYEAAFERYRAEARGHSPKTSSLAGQDRKVYDSVCAICEWRLGRGPAPEGPEATLAPIAVQEMVDCLRLLRKSVERHTKSGGRQGYLTFVDGYLP